MKLSREQKAERNRLVYALAMALHRAMGEEARTASDIEAFRAGTWRPTWWAATGVELAKVEAGATPPAVDACSEDLAGVAE